MFRDQSIDELAVSTVNTETDFSFVEVTGEIDQVLKMSITPKHSSIGLTAPVETTQICVTIKATDLLEEENEANKTALDLCIALDISGSMSGQKLRDCKQTLTAMLRPLSATDRFGLITFGSSAKVVFPASFMTKDNKELALKKISSLSTAGCTNLSGGLSLAWQELMLIKKPNTVRSVFLLTDGQANEGITNTDDLVDMVKSFGTTRNPNKVYAAVTAAAAAVAAAVGGGGGTDQQVPETISVDSKDSPVSLFCFGYGSDHNSDMLQAISSATSGGAYYFVENDSDVAGAFGDAFGGLLSVVAQSAVLKISVPQAAKVNGVEILEVYHDEKIKKKGGSFTVNIGDFYAEETRDVILDVKLSSSPDAIPHALVTLSYVDVIHKKYAEIGPIECSVNRLENTSEVSPPNVYVESQWIRIRTVQELEAADKEAGLGQTEKAQQRLKDLLKLITGSNAYDPNSPLMKGMVSDVKDVLKSIEIVSTGEVSYLGHTTKNRLLSMKKQRCMASSAAQSVTYRTARKAKMSESLSTPSGTDQKDEIYVKPDGKKVKRVKNGIPLLFKNNI